ncbi:unnamed protein product [Microthlaspi erraticum]|uniref:GRAM domain-containing protein n=1 Tax=Microthlaspi erraticum TaxID=1685480 RepID=A0A6D2IBS6_9BRAS|nr:unnamed protein product [Microthlaspi erraticum]
MIEYLVEKEASGLRLEYIVVVLSPGKMYISTSESAGLLFTNKSFKILPIGTNSILSKTGIIFETLYAFPTDFRSRLSPKLAGLLFISSKKIAFCSERSIKVASPQGDLIRVHYKVSIPLCKIKGVNQSLNTKNPSLKYLQVVTVDEHQESISKICLSLPLLLLKVLK